MTFFTNDDYLNKKCTHGEYFRQFITPATLPSIWEVIPKEQILNSVHHVLNDTPLRKWDWLSGYAAANKKPLLQFDQTAMAAADGGHLWHHSILSLAKQAALEWRNHQNGTYPFEVGNYRWVARRVGNGGHTLTADRLTRPVALADRFIELLVNQHYIRWTAESFINSVAHRNPDEPLTIDGMPQAHNQISHNTAKEIARWLAL